MRSTESRFFKNPEENVASHENDLVPLKERIVALWKKGVELQLHEQAELDILVEKFLAREHGAFTPENPLDEARNDLLQKQAQAEIKAINDAKTQGPKEWYHPHLTEQEEHEMGELEDLLSISPAHLTGEQYDRLMWLINEREPYEPPEKTSK